MILRILLLALLAIVTPAAAHAQAPVTVTDNGSTWTLDNGIVRATIARDTGAMPSLV